MVMAHKFMCHYGHGHEKKKKTQIGDTFGKQASTQDLKHAWPWHGPKATVTWMAHKDAGMDQGTICQSFSSMDA